MNRSHLRFGAIVVVGLALAACAPKQRFQPLSLPLDAPPPAPAARSLTFPDEVTRRLPNGMEVVVLPMPATGTVTLRVVLPGGESAEPADRAGLAALTAEALKLGTPSADAATLAAHIDRLGSSISFGCDADQCVGKAEALTRNLDETLGLLGELLLTPTFPEEALQVLKGEWGAWLAYQETRSSFVAMRVAHRLLYGDHPYARFAATMESLTATTRDDVLAFHRRAMGPTRALLVAAGDLDPADFLARAEAIFGGWQVAADGGAGTVVTPPPKATVEPVIYLVDRPGAVQATIIAAHRALPRTHGGYLAARVADEVLGGGAARRLFLDLREKRGLTYGAGSFLDARRHGGHVAATAEVRTEKVGAAMQALLDQLARLRDEPVPEAELTEATRYLAGSLAIRMDHPGQVTGLVARQRLLGLPADEWTSWPRRVRSIDAASVQGAARNLWRESDGLLLLVVGAAEELKPQLEAIRPVRLITPE